MVAAVSSKSRSASFWVALVLHTIILSTQVFAADVSDESQNLDSDFCGGALSTDGQPYSDGLLVENSGGLNLPGPFTLEARVFLREVAIDRFNIIVMKYSGSGTGREYRLVLLPGGYPQVWLSIDGTLTVGKTFGADSGQAVPAKSWTHIAGVFDGQALKVYVNGILTSPIVLSPAPPTSSTFPVVVASNLYFPSFNQTVDGWVDEVRISNTARYSSDFSVPSTKFVADANTLLLMHFDGNTENLGLVGGDGTLQGSARLANCAERLFTNGFETLP